MISPFGPFGMMPGGGRPEFVSATARNNVTGGATLPSFNAGDLMFAWVTQVTDNLSAASGWTQAAVNNAGGYKYGLFYRIMATGDTDPDFGLTGTNGIYFVAWRNSVFKGGGSIVEAFDTDVDITISSNNGDTVLVFAVSRDTVDITAPASFTEDAEVTSGFFQLHTSHREFAIVTSPQTVTRASGTNEFAAVSVVVSGI